MWNIIKNAALTAWEAIKNAWNNVSEWFSGIWNSIKTTASELWTNVKKYFSDAWNNIKNIFSGWGTFFGGLWTSIKSKFGSIGSSLGTSMGNAVKSGMNGVISTVEKAINKGIGLINSAISLANKIPGVNVGKVGKISLPRLVEGGILKKGQIGFLEGSGAEAVIPLEKNTQWISNVAKEMKSYIDEDQKPKNNFDGMYSRMDMILDKLDKLMERSIFLDTGLLVGEMAPSMNAELGTLYNYSKRHTKG